MKHYKKPVFWIVMVAVVTCVLAAVWFLTNPNNGKYGKTDQENLNASQLALKESYPEYFGLDASQGLDVYVYQMAKNSYSFVLLPHSATPRDWMSSELRDIHGVSAAQMRTILSIYPVDQDEIYVIPWQNPYSSYIGEYWIVREGEDLEAKRAAYVENLRKMLFDAE